MTQEALPGWDGRDVAELLELAPVSPRSFRSRFGERNEHGRIFGGQLLGQSLWAASRTVPADRPATYLQFLFVAGALTDQAITYDVTPLQDGKRFSSRAVRGAQRGGRIVCDASVSFAMPIDSPRHQARPPVDCGLDRDPEKSARLEEIDAPEARQVERTLDYAYRTHAAMDMRVPYVEDLLHADPDQPRMRYWIRIRDPLRDEPALHAAAFAYLSDYWINFAACIAHVPTRTELEAKLYVASLNHAIWFHRPLRADQWMLFDCQSPSGGFGRGLSVGRIYSQTGELVASATQECLLAPVV